MALENVLHLAVKKTANFQPKSYLHKMFTNIHIFGIYSECNDLNFHFRGVLFLTRISWSSFGFMNLSEYALCYMLVYVLIACVFIAKVLYGRCPLTCCNAGLRCQGVSREMR